MGRVPMNTELETAVSFSLDEGDSEWGSLQGQAIRQVGVDNEHDPVVILARRQRGASDEVPSLGSPRSRS